MGETGTTKCQSDHYIPKQVSCTQMGVRLPRCAAPRNRLLP